MKYNAIIFDFDGVLIESEYVGNKQIADYLTAIGHPTSMEESMTKFMGLAGTEFLTALENHIGRPLPEDFHAARSAEDARALAEESTRLPAPWRSSKACRRLCPRRLPHRARSNGSSAILFHIGLAGAFGDRIFQRPFHVARGKPARTFIFTLRRRWAC